MFKIIEEAPPQWLLDDIAGGNDKLKDNYTLENIKLQEMICFCMLMYNDDIVGFSGLQRKPLWPEPFGDWEDNTPRVNSRCYIAPKFRQYKIRGDRIRYPWKYLAPYQIEMADKMGYNKLFWSTELYKRPGKTMDLTIEYAKKYLPENWHYNRLECYRDINGVEQEVCEILKS